MTEEDYQTVIEDATKRAVAAGVRTLQINWLAPTAKEHAEKLLELMNPPAHASILDMGSGLGEVAYYMSQKRKDLSFTLLNNNVWQINETPTELDCVFGFMDRTELPSHIYDVVMFNYSIGYCDLWTVLTEARRLLRSDGTLFVWDLEGSNPELYYDTGYRIHDADHFEACARAAGFNLWFSLNPPVTSAHLPEPEATYAREVFSKSKPICWKFSAR
jgi:SAM-dependent methyltransferase